MCVIGGCAHNVGTVCCCPYCYALYKTFSFTLFLMIYQKIYVNLKVLDFNGFYIALLTYALNFIWCCHHAVNYCKRILYINKVSTRVKST